MEESVIWCLSQVEPTFFLWALVVAVAAYFLGCFNGAVIVSKYILRDDVRGHGSGNAGLTNFYRTFGGALTFVVILTDVLKAVIAILLGRYLFSFAGFWELELLGKYWAALFCLLGHMFPCMFHFKGGKGILSGGTIAIMMDWRIAMVVWGGFLILAIVTKYVSLGSVWAGGSFPFISWYCYPDPKDTYSVSYTHLDVYKRQPHISTTPSTQLDTGPASAVRAMPSLGFLK